MIPSFNTHYVQTGEKIRHLSELYGISESDILSCHNKHADVRNSIWTDITHNKEIYVPRYAVVDRSRLVPLSSGNRLVFNPKDTSLRYGVTIAFIYGEKQKELKYEVSVDYLHSEDNLHYFQIDRESTYYINEQEVNSIAGEITHKSSQVLYPMIISVNWIGQWHEVQNTKEFLERFPMVKDKVHKEYIGEMVDGYLNEIEYILQQPELTNYLLKNDLFIRSLFFGVCQNYGKKYKTKGNEGFPVVRNAVEPVYEITLEVDPLKDAEQQVVVEGEGRLIDPRSIEDFMAKLPMPALEESKEDQSTHTEGSCWLKYFLEPDTGMVQSCYAEYDIFLPEQQKITVSIARL